MLHTLQVRIGQCFPINLVLIADGRLAFTPVAPFTAILEPIDPIDPSVVAGYFFQDGFRFFTETEEEEFFYNTAYSYKEYPLMKKWLIQQNIPQPRG